MPRLLSTEMPVWPMRRFCLLLLGYGLDYSFAEPIGVKIISFGPATACVCYWFAMFFFAFRFDLLCDYTGAP